MSLQPWYLARGITFIEDKWLTGLPSTDWQIIYKTVKDFICNSAVIGLQGIAIYLTQTHCALFPLFIVAVCVVILQYMILLLLCPMSMVVIFFVHCIDGLLLPFNVLPLLWLVSYSWLLIVIKTTTWLFFYLLVCIDFWVIALK